VARTFEHPAAEVVDIRVSMEAITRVPQPNGRIRVDSTKGGVDIRVILDPANGGRIVTGFPTNLPRNP
jgi:filamentous hemagglutinin